MSIEEAGHYIFGINENGSKFRPSDWIVRIASTFGSFDVNRRLRYNPSIMPAKYDGQHCLFVAEKLLKTNPSAYRYVMDFVNSNCLVVKTIVQPETELTHVAA